MRLGVTKPEDNRRIDELVTEQIKGMEGEERENNDYVSEFGKLVKWWFHFQESGE